MCVCVFNLFQDGAVVTCSRPVGDTLPVSEVEADSGDGPGRMDCSPGDASWPSSDHADVRCLVLIFLSSSVQPLSRFVFKLRYLQVFCYYFLSLPSLV